MSTPNKGKNKMSTSYEKDEIESVMDSPIDNKVGSIPTEFDVSLAAEQLIEDLLEEKL